MRSLMPKKKSRGTTLTVQFSLTSMNGYRSMRHMSLSKHLRRPGVTAVSIAQQMGVSHTSVLRWAAGSVPVKRLPELARVTGIPARDLRPDLAHLLKAQRKGRRHD
jgi:DNA-binding transcriptional regulator YdaS (Cro superfamily)